MATMCFCGHEQKVKGTRIRATNFIGGQMQTDVQTFEGVMADGLVPDLEDELTDLVATGKPLLEEVSAVVHGGAKADDFKSRVKAWTDRAGAVREPVESAVRDAGYVGKWFASTGRQAYSGVQADGVILKVRDTGSTVNNDPRIEISIRVTPPEGEPFDVSKKLLVARTNMPRPNEAVEVSYDPDDPTEFVWRLKPAGAAPAAPDRIEQLERLQGLRESGALSDDEFEAEKRRLLDDG